MKDGAARQSRGETRGSADAGSVDNGSHDRAGNIVAVLASDYSVTGWSSAAERVSGWPAKSAIGHMLPELFAELDEAEIIRASRSGNPVDAASKASGAAGATRLALNIVPLDTPSGESGAFAVIMRVEDTQVGDIGFRRDDANPAANRASGGPPPSFLLDPTDGTVLDVSDPAALLLGLDRNELVGSKIDDILRKSGAVIGPDATGGILDGGDLSLPDAGSGGMSRAYACSVVPLSSPDRALVLLVLHEVTRWLDLEAELSRANVELSRMARHDHLTGLFNKAMFLDTLALANSRLERTDGMLGVLYIDLDGFKPVNDRFGHDAGDRVLVEVAQRLRRAVRASDVVARLGGDEFGAILENLRVPEDAVKVARHIIEQIAEPLDVTGTQVVMSASIGAVVTGRMVPDSGALLIQADWQMYQAKSTGHGQVGLGRVHEPGKGRRVAPGK